MSRRALGRLVGALIVVTALAACTPEQQAAFADLDRLTRGILTLEQASRLRSCEAGGVYEAVSSTGKYRGAYQFDQSTWDGVASRHAPWLVGRHPAGAEPYWQDLLARALYSERGGGPWPTCRYSAGI